MDTALSAISQDRLRANLERVQERIRAAEQQAGRPPDSARLLPVVKKVPAAVVAALADLGIRDVAENRVQSLRDRPPALRERLRFHLIGHLQSNKARAAVGGFASFHGLDSERLAAVLESEAARVQRRWPVYLQVNLGGETQKYGCLLEDLPPLADAVVKLSHLEIRGLMGMPPWDPDPEKSRPLFRRLREAAEEFRSQGILPPTAVELSMGMSNDYSVAVEEGATVVRVGTALYQGLVATEPPAR